MYLLEDTEEARGMRQKVRDLLLSQDFESLKLAIQLIVGGGMHRDFVAPLCVRAIPFLWKGLADKDNALLWMLEKVLTEEQIKHIKKEAYLFRSWEAIAVRFANATYLKSMQEYADDLLLCAFLWVGKGGQYCHRRKLLPLRTILEIEAKEEKKIDLAKFGIDTLIDELASLDVNVIGLSEDIQITLPAWKNPYVNWVGMPDYISRREIIILEQCFPQAELGFYNKGVKMARSESTAAQRAGEADDASRIGKQALVFLRRVPKEDRDIDYYEARGLAYNVQNRLQMAFVCYEHIRKNYTEEEYRSIAYNMACNFACMGNRTEMLRYITKFLIDTSLYGKLENHILSDSDFKDYVKDVDLLYLIKLRMKIRDREEFEEAVQKYLNP